MCFVLKGLTLIFELANTYLFLKSVLPGSLIRYSITFTLMYKCLGMSEYDKCCKTDLKGYVNAQPIYQIQYKMLYKENKGDTIVINSAKCFANAMTNGDSPSAFSKGFIVTFTSKVLYGGIFNFSVYQDIY